MNKRNTRAFAFGILVAVCIIGLYYLFTMKENTHVDIDIKDAKLLLESNGYIILTKEKYENMEEANKVEPKKTETPQKPPATTPKTEEIITAFTLEIISGMVSHDIASLLEKKKIIDDAEQFETYLEENGYSKRIQLGSFELKAGMTYKQIAKIITKS